jgi:hypothetical protein
MAAKQVLNNVASSNFKLKLSKVGTLYHSHSFQITSAIYTTGRVLLGLPSYTPDGHAGVIVAGLSQLLHRTRNNQYYS